MKYCKCMALLACLALLVGCASSAQVVGCWRSEDPSGYYFELYEDGSCIMFDAADKWVSSGHYKVKSHRLVFETDTGDFTWVETEDGMAFETGDTTVYYRLSE